MDFQLLLCKGLAVLGAWPLAVLLFGGYFRAEISSMRSIGRRARWIMSAGSSIRGARCFMQSRTFSSVFIFMYLHSLQWQGSVGERNASSVGAQKNCLSGHSFCI